MAYIAFYYRYKESRTTVFDSKEEAISFLEFGQDYNELMAIAVIDHNSGEVVWNNGYDSIAECEQKFADHLIEMAI